MKMVDSVGVISGINLIICEFTRTLNNASVACLKNIVSDTRFHSKFPDLFDKLKWTNPALVPETKFKDIQHMFNEEELDDLLKTFFKWIYIQFRKLNNNEPIFTGNYLVRGIMVTVAKMDARIAKSKLKRKCGLNIPFVIRHLPIHSSSKLLNLFGTRDFQPKHTLEK